MQVTSVHERAGIWPERLSSALARQGALIALLLLVLFGAMRYDGFLGAYNITELLRYNAMFGLVALGMTFVIMTGGIDLSVGSVAALASVVAALLSPYGVPVAVLAAVLVGLALGLVNGSIIAYLDIPPFITTLAMLLGARGLALLLSNNTSIFAAPFIPIGLQTVLGLPVAVVVLIVAYLGGMLVQSYTRFGRHVLAVGGNEDATRLMGLPVDRIKLAVYGLSGALAGAAGVLLAIYSSTGVPTEGVGWELSAIAAVVVGGTLLTGGVGSVGTTLVGVLLLGLIFNLLNFESGKGVISLSPYWQSVIRGGFLLVVVILQSRLAKRKG